MALWEYLGAWSGTTLALYHFQNSPNDSSNSYNLTPSNIYYNSTESRMGKYCSGFNGTSSQFYNWSSFTTNWLSNFTASFWWYPVSTPNYYNLFIIPQSGWWGSIYLQTQTNKQYSFRFGDTVTNNGYNNIQWNYVTNWWNFTTIALINNNAYAYENWNQIMWPTSQAVLAWNSTTIYIGSNAGSNNWFDGYMWDVIFENVWWNLAYHKKIYTYWLGRFWIL